MIVDNELVGVGAVADDEEFPHYPSIPMGRRIGQMLWNNFEKYGDTLWMTDLSTGKSMMYGQLISAMNRVASALRKRGLNTNDVVLLMGGNRLEMAIMYLAVWTTGGCCGSFGLNSHPADVIKSKAKETGAKFVLTDVALSSVARQAVGDCVQVIVIGQADGCIPFDQLLAEGDENESAAIGGSQENCKFDMETPVWLAFSSGTTGLPKCIVHTHRSLAGIFLVADRGVNMKERTVGRKKLMTNGMIHGSGVGGILSGVLNYEHVYIMSEPATGESILKSIQETKASFVSLYPRELTEIYNHPEANQYDLSSVNVLMALGTNIMPVYEKWIIESMPNLTNLFNSYGQTELFGLAAAAQLFPTTKEGRAEFLKNYVRGSVGKVYPFARLRIVDVDTGEKLEPGKIGEITAKSPFLMKGYLNQPEETMKLVRNSWYHTGDQGYYDSDGNLFVTGRISELMKYRSINVSPFQIEAQLLTHPSVKEVAVVGLPHEEDGQHPMAFVVRKDGIVHQSVTAEELIAYASERTSDAEKLRGGVHFTGKIPRNDAGKIVRYKLVQEAQAIKGGNKI